MALPVIKFNSSTGSDEFASGAGPAIAITGAAATTSADGTVISLDGSPDLSNVLSDGSHVIFMNYSLDSVKSFASIINVDNSGKIITVPSGQAFPPFGTNLPWAIGGKRRSLSSTSSRKLAMVGATSGDIMPGWTLEFEDGFTDTFSSGITFKRPTDNIDGPITIRAASGVSTRPVLTISLDSTFININTAALSHVILQGFDLKNTAAANNGNAINVQGTQIILTLKDMKISDPTDNFFRIIRDDSGADCHLNIIDCDLGNCTNNVVLWGNCSLNIIGNYFHGVGGSVISAGGGFPPSTKIRNNIFNANNTAINLSPASTNTSIGSISIEENTIINNINGIEISSASTSVAVYRNLSIINNNITHNVRGIYLTGSSVTAGFLSNIGTIIESNNFGTGSSANPSGHFAGVTGLPSTNNYFLDPQFASTGTLDFSVGENLKAIGFNTDNFLGTITRSYVDIGAVQREEPEETPAGSGTGGISKSRLIGGI